MLTESDLQAIARDLEACDIGMAMTKGKTRARYAAHAKACYAAIKADNKALGLDKISDADLLAELGIAV